MRATDVSEREESVPGREADGLGAGWEASWTGEPDPRHPHSRTGDLASFPPGDARECGIGH